MLKFTIAEIAQLGERQTEDLKVPGSNPENSNESWIIPGLGKFFRIQLLWNSQRNLRLSPFFLCLASSDRPRFLRFQTQKGNEDNDTLFQTIFTVIWNISNFCFTDF